MTTSTSRQAAFAPVIATGLQITRQAVFIPMIDSSLNGGGNMPRRRMASFVN
ncbi:hypothetical protein [Croceicoccus bisphenolivorans]|uniref:hypothetical protein n=1 Tax=Croceicoccus bisphenolivorans TaxID=1783232 RepID=UPI000AB524EC|nr:hypothetical protein [Croceicoccus bisphenolivorans]